MLATQSEIKYLATKELLPCHYQIWWYKWDSNSRPRRCLMFKMFEQYGLVSTFWMGHSFVYFHSFHKQTTSIDAVWYSNPGPHNHKISNSLFCKQFGSTLKLISWVQRRNEQLQLNDALLNISRVFIPQRIPAVDVLKHFSEEI